jgi:hypothetical protein
MAQVGFGALPSRSPEFGVTGRRRYRRYWRHATTIRPAAHPARFDFSHITQSSNSKFEIFVQRQLTVSGGQGARMPRRPGLEALGG